MSTLAQFNALSDSEKAHIQSKAEEAVEGMSCISSWMADEVTDGVKELLAGLFIQSKTKITQLRTDAEAAKKNIPNTPEYKALESDRNTVLKAKKEAEDRIRKLENNITEYQADLEDKETDFDIVFDIAKMLDERFGTQISFQTDKYAAGSVFSILSEIIPNAELGKVSFTTNGSKTL